MNKNLGWKLGVIVAAMLLFVYGVFGIPSGVSGSALADALLKPSALRNGIHLGLDLKGGTHLILQVQVNDAVNFETDNAMQTLKAAMSRAKVNYAAITKPDPTNRPDRKFKPSSWNVAAGGREYPFHAGAGIGASS